METREPMAILNGMGRQDVLRPVQKHEEPELVSAKTLAIILDVKLATIRYWINIARTHRSPNSIPFIQLPNSRLIRFPLKKVREWYTRGTFCE